MDDQLKNNGGDVPATSPSIAGAEFKSVEFDWKRFEHYLYDPAMSDDQKEEFIITILNISLAFIDLGFGINPVQQACGQNPVYYEISTLNLNDLLELSPSLNFEEGHSNTIKEQEVLGES